MSRHVGDLERNDEGQRRGECVGVDRGSSHRDVRALKQAVCQVPNPATPVHSIHPWCSHTLTTERVCVATMIFFL